MSLVKVIKKTFSPTIRSGGTFEVLGDINISSGLVIQLNSSIFNLPGLWTLVTWTGTLTGSAANITIDSSGIAYAVGAVYVDGKAFKVVLS